MVAIRPAGCSVFLVEDEVMIRMMVADMLEELGYSVAAQPSLDGNSVDMDRERANFVDNTVRYEAALRFINGSAKTILSAIQGQ